MKDKLYQVVLILFAILSVVLFFKDRSNKNKIVKLTDEIKVLTEKKAEVVTIYKDKVRVIYRDKDNNVTTSETYVPPEGNVRVEVEDKEKLKVDLVAVKKELELEKEKNKKEALEKKAKEIEKDINKDPEIIIKDKGLCLKPGAGVVFTGTTLPELDIKFAYYQRWSAKVGCTTKFIDIGITRHLDDIIADFHNVEAQVIFGIGWDNSKHLGVGIRVNF